MTVRGGLHRLHAVSCINIMTGHCASIPGRQGRHQALVSAPHQSSHRNNTGPRRCSQQALSPPCPAGAGPSGKASTRKKQEKSGSVPDPWHPHCYKVKKTLTGTVKGDRGLPRKDRHDAWRGAVSIGNRSGSCPVVESYFQC